ncbi:DUF4388 domain-containing protein [Calidithermus chliarophilus]|uniref:DUF4388 domain-containing protein n=1 Tax=Calidithermus chliarophilus TaxID=52023 RepID=UPI00042043BF|nr:DUF4388 domain-containing protein [Calidithermus chliarophilus]
MKALIVAANLESTRALQQAFIQSGFEIQTETSALYALTLLERNRPDVVVSLAQLSDMSGVEFYELVRSDEALRFVAFILLSPESPPNVSRIDSVMPPAVIPGEVVRQAYQKVLEVTRQTYEVSSAAPIREAIQGVLGDISLFDLAQWLARSAKTGRLVVHLDPHHATLYFLKGQLIHAQFGDKSGEDAVLHLMIQAETNRDGSFGFEPKDASDLFLEPVTIHKSTDQLLLSLAVEIDHRQAGSSLN